MKKQHLQSLAGIFWLGIGIMLTVRGIFTLTTAQDMGASVSAIGLAAGLALIIGLAKGRFVLSKSARRNRDRIGELTEPVRAWQVFSVKFYPLILLMMGMGIGIRHFFVNEGSATAHLSYGALLCGIGGALFISAFAYWGAFNKEPLSAEESSSL
jgi:hypothetical protein